VSKLAHNWGDVVRVRLKVSYSSHWSCDRSCDWCGNRSRWSSGRDWCWNYWSLSHRSWDWRWDLYGRGRSRSLSNCWCRSRWSSSRSIADYSKNRANRNGFVFLDQNLLDHAGNWRRNLGVYLVGGDLNQWLVNGNGVADLLEPSGDGSFGY
jgi:hypothetical protein